MSKLIIVMGESGAGKSTSLRTLPPEHTLYIDADGKGLSWKGWRKQYNAEAKNYVKTNEALDIQSYLNIVHESRPHINYVVIDTINSIMVADEMRRMKEKNYDKWADLAQCIYYIIAGANEYRDDLTIIVLAHTQTVDDENGYRFTCVKTSGKKLNKICLESFANWVVLARKKGDQHVFEVHANSSSAKTPLGAFETEEIPNDIMKVIEVMEEY